MKKSIERQINVTVYCRHEFKGPYGPIVDLYFIWKLCHEIVSGFAIGESRIYSSSTEGCESNRSMKI